MIGTPSVVEDAAGVTTEVQGVGAAVEAEAVDDVGARPTAGRLAVEDEDLRTVALARGPRR